MDTSSFFLRCVKEVTVYDDTFLGSHVNIVAQFTNVETAETKGGVSERPTRSKCESFSGTWMLCVGDGRFGSSLLGKKAILGRSNLFLGGGRRRPQYFVDQFGRSTRSVDSER